MSPTAIDKRVRVGHTAVAALLLLLLLLAWSASAHAAITNFGSMLARPATRNTSANLGYVGIFTRVPPSSQAPNGIYRTPHWGADTALWNAKLARGRASAPASGQALVVRLEGCAASAPGGPPPLTQIHFQDLSPLPGGGTRVKLTSQPFDMPVCGQNGANTRTITAYRPINLCVGRGDYVALNDEGGYVPNFYPAGVPYRVIAGQPQSTMNSFIRGGGTGNGARMSALDRTAEDGFAANRGEELLLQVELGTGANATRLCPGGRGGH
jgi:hypothetical protein